MPQKRWLQINKADIADATKAATQQAAQATLKTELELNSTVAETKGASPKCALFTAPTAIALRSAGQGVGPKHRRSRGDMPSRNAAGTAPGSEG